MMSLRGVRFAYRDGFALHVPSLVLEPGERVAIVGPSGSGKTTLLNLVSGISSPQEGLIEVVGSDVTAMNDGERRAHRAAHIGFVFQEFALVDYLTAHGNVLYPYRVGRGLRLDATVRQRARDLLDACGLAGKHDRHPARLSQGERQRVAICRALVTQPSLILADEATGNLDPANKSAVLDLLFDRAAENDAAILAVTHDHELLSRFDRTIDFAEFRDRAAA